MSNRRYAPEFKDEAVRQVLERSHSVREVKRGYGTVTKIDELLDDKDLRDPLTSVITPTRDIPNWRSSVTRSATLSVGLPMWSRSFKDAIL